MIKVLVTGQNSYVGNSFIQWISAWKDKYQVDKISLRGDRWKETSFSGYDVILHVAGIAHVKENPGKEGLYYKVNRDLTIETAKKAKREGVKQFVFLSSMSVYGKSNTMNKSIFITKETKPAPSGFYGNSKLQAEEGILSLHEEKFKIVIIRAPMIYGKGSKGNFQRLVKIAKWVPVFPKIENQRSMIYIENLCEFLRLLIVNGEVGIFHPQNKEYVNTSDMVQEVGKNHHHKVRATVVLNPVIWLLQRCVNTVNKVFGTFVYDQELSRYGDGTYQVVGFEQSISASKE